MKIDVLIRSYIAKWNFLFIHIIGKRRRKEFKRFLFQMIFIQWYKFNKKELSS